MEEKLLIEFDRVARLSLGMTMNLTRLFPRRWTFCRGSARKRTNPRGNARTPPGSARIHRPSAKNNFRRTSGGHWRTPPESARIRADSAANWRSCSLKKLSARKIIPNTIVCGGKMFTADILPRRTLPRRRLSRRTFDPRVTS